MKTPFALVLLAGVTACASAPRTGEVSPGLSSAPAAPIKARLETQAERSLSLWTDPGFQQRFIESYLAENEVEPSVTNEELLQLEEVRDLFFEERFDRALEVLHKYNGPDTSAIYDFYIGNVHFQREEFPEATAAYLAAVQKYPKFLRAWKNLGLIQVRTDDSEGGIESLTKVLQLGGNDADTYGAIGYAYSAVGNKLSAESAFRMATLLDPGNGDWRISLARTLFDQGRYAEAASLTGYLIEQEPANTGLWLLQASAYIGMGQPLDAAANLELVERMGAATPEALFNLGDIYINQQVFDLGVDAYVRALESEGDLRLDRAIRAARHLAMSGSQEETLRLMEAIRKHQGDGLDTQMRKELLKLEVRLASSEGSTEAEAAALQKIVDLDPLDGDALLRLGKVYERAEEPDRAVMQYERAARIAAFEVRAKVAHARVLARQQRYAEAVPLLRAAQGIEPSEDVNALLEDLERAARSN